MYWKLSLKRRKEHTELKSEFNYFLFIPYAHKKSNWKSPTLNLCWWLPSSVAAALKQILKKSTISIHEINSCIFPHIESKIKIILSLLKFRKKKSPKVICSRISLVFLWVLPAKHWIFRGSISAIRTVQTFPRAITARGGRSSRSTTFVSRTNTK